MMIEITNVNFQNSEFNRVGDDEYLLYIHQSPSNKFYIGITCCGIVRRWRVDGSGYYKCPRFYRAIKKYGWKNFKHFIIETGMNKIDAEQAEIELIQKYKDNGYSLYNISLGGNAAFAGIPLTEEHRRKISEGNKGKPAHPKTPEGLRRLSVAHQGNQHALGYHHTEETKKIISQKLKGRKLPPRSAEHCKHISEAKKGQKLTEAHKQKISENMRGRKPSQKSIQRLIEYNKTRECPVALLEKLSKPVVQYDIHGNQIALFPSIADASRSTGIDNSLIGKCCKGKLKTAHGYVWKYANNTMKGINEND